MFLASQLQAATSGQVDVLYLGGHCGDPGGPQSILQSHQGVHLVLHPHLDQPPGGKAERLQTRRVEVVAPADPDNRPSRRQRLGQQGGETGCDGPDLHLHPLASQFMPAAQRQAAARQAVVHARIAKRQDDGWSPSPRFQSGHLAPDGRQSR